MRKTMASETARADAAERESLLYQHAFNIATGAPNALKHICERESGNLCAALYAGPVSGVVLLTDGTRTYPMWADDIDPDKHINDAPMWAVMDAMHHNWRQHQLSFA